jgi:hypothetical protein
MASPIPITNQIPLHLNGENPYGCPLEPTPKDIFIKNLPKNILLALCTVPAECLAVRRILFSLDHSERAPLSYTSTLRQIGLRSLFSGSTSRLSYCLGGTFATLQGIHTFGSDYRGLFITAVVKNIILPLSLLANARQTQLSWQETISFVRKGSFDRGAHISFFSRNLLANSCLIPGFFARDYCYQVLGEKNTALPALVGLTVSTITSTGMNVLLKPFFTGKYPLEVRYTVAKKLPAALPIFFRELASIGVIFANSSPKPLRE